MGLMVVVGEKVRSGLIRRGSASYPIAGEVFRVRKGVWLSV